MPNNPQVERLVELVQRLGLRIAPCPDHPDTGIFDYRRLMIENTDQRVTVPVSDEFGDVPLSNPVVLLHLILTECEQVEEASSYEEWVVDAGLAKAANDDARLIHSELAEALPRVRSMVGHDIRAVHSHDIEFNTGAAKALRAATIAADDSALKSRILGVLLGTAVGDALGLPYEGLSKRRQQRIARRPLNHRFLFGKGMISDDTEHTLFVAQSLIEHPDDVDGFRTRLARAIKWWFLALPAGIGLGTARACLRLWVGISPVHSGVHSAGNGPAMRVAPIGAFFHDRPEQLAAYVTASTRITHSDERALIGALAVARVVAWSVGHTPEEPIDARTFRDLISVPEHECAEWDARLDALADAVEQDMTVAQFAESINQGNGVSGYVFNTVPVCLFAWFVHFAKLDEALEAVISCGGDSDTTGAIIGAMSGSLCGSDGIPRDWVTGVRDWPRGMRLLHETGDRLLHVSVTQSASTAVAYPLGACLPRNLLFLAVVLAHGFRRVLPPY